MEHLAHRPGRHAPRRPVPAGAAGEPKTWRPGPDPCPGNGLHTASQIKFVDIEQACPGNT
ncbi:hypothetical protein MRQ86_01055 [Streptomyces sp. MMS21 TC-5]|uniref:hypothetical protein n=1 Tax=Streptomyces sp. MMS21 TC-5 TaxID=2925833 RepID=UPI001F620916|nr:hypothetical protein [Streptomyces sp. MMS21 TC-5]MCI4078962.1 hypothetical protein [Streptomyces sp. MMS21 TC-5]